MLYPLSYGRIGISSWRLRTLVRAENNYSPDVGEPRIEAVRPGASHYFAARASAFFRALTWDSSAWRSTMRRACMRASRITA